MPENRITDKQSLIALAIDHLSRIGKMGGLKWENSGDEPASLLPVLLCILR